VPNLLAKRKSVTFDRIVYYVSTPHLVLLKAEFYALSGKIFKAAVFETDNRLNLSKPYFSPVTALKVNWTGGSATAIALVSHRDNGVNRLEAYGTLTLSDALLLYGDGSLGQRLNPQKNFLGRLYAMAQLGRTDRLNKLDVTLRYVQAFNAPPGDNLALSLNNKLNPAAELFALGQWKICNPQSELLQFDRLTIMSVLHYY
jgi:hypothetical protein